MVYLWAEIELLLILCGKLKLQNNPAEFLSGKKIHKPIFKLMYNFWRGDPFCISVWAESVKSVQYFPVEGLLEVHTTFIWKASLSREIAEFISECNRHIEYKRKEFSTAELTLLTQAQGPVFCL